MFVKKQESPAMWREKSKKKAGKKHPRKGLFKQVSYTSVATSGGKFGLPLVQMIERPHIVVNQS